MSKTFSNTGRIWMEMLDEQQDEQDPTAQRMMAQVRAAIDAQRTALAPTYGSENALNAAVANANITITFAL